MPEDLCSALFATARHAPATIALAWPRAEGGEESWAHGRLLEAAERAARELARRGVVRGDRVALFAATSPAFVVAALGALRAGATLVPINTAYRRREIAHLLEDAAPKLLLVGSGERAAVEELTPGERGGVEAILDVEPLVGRRLGAGPGAPRDRPRRPRAPALHLGHHRPEQGGGAQPRQPRRHGPLAARSLALDARPTGCY